MHRGRSQWGLLGVVAAVSLLACTLTAGLALTYHATREFGLAHTLAGIEPGRTSVVVSVLQGNAQKLEPGLGRVGAAVDDALRLPVVSRTEATTSEWATRSESLDSPTLLYFAHLDGVEQHARVVAGHLPTPADQVGAEQVAVAVPRTLADAAGLRLGSRLPTVELSTSSSAEAVVVGIYEVSDLQRKDAFWFPDALSGTTFDPSYPMPGSFGMLSVSAYGPLLSVRDAFATGPLHPGRTVLTTVPDLSGITPQTLPGLQRRVAGLERDIPRLVGDAPVQQARASTRLAATLDVVNRSLVVTTAGLMITGILLVILAVAALLLATRLLAERRSTEQTLMRARGASGWQLARLAAVEAGALALVTGVAAPLLALPAYRLVAGSDLFADAGLDRDPGLPPAVWLVGGGTALALVTVLLTPLLRRAGTFVEQEQAAARQDRRSMIQRSGLDVALLVLAAIGYWQLLRYASPLASGADGPSADPLLVAGPGMVLLAGGLLSVRAIPLLARRLERVAARGPAVVWPLASWEVGRRARRSVGAVLLLSLTVAAGTFSLAFLDTWRTSQVDQADAEVGADAVVDLSLDTRPGAQLARLTEVSERAGVRLDAVSPVLTGEAGLSVAGETGIYGPNTNVSYGVPVQLLGVDSPRVAGMLRGRPARPGGEADDLLEQLPTLAPAPATGVPVPRGTTVLGVDAWLTSKQLGVGLEAVLSAVVDDASGVRHRIELGILPADGARHRLAVPVPEVFGGSGATDGAAGHVRAVQVRWQLTDYPDYAQGPPSATLTLTRITGGTAARPQPLPLDGLGRPELTSIGITGVSVERSRVQAPGNRPPGAAPAPQEDALVVSASLVPDESRPVDIDVMTTALVAWPASAPVRAVATPGALARFGLSVGAEVALVVDQTAVPVVLAATTPFVPGTDGHREAVIVDADALSRRLVEYGQDGPTMTRWWVDVDDTDVPALITAVKGASGTTVSAYDTARAARRASLAVGLQTAQWVVVIAAALLAGVGFALNTAVAIRLRRIEFAQLLALGVRRRDLERVVTAETVLLWGVGVVCGLVVGLLLIWTLPSLVAMSAPGGIPVPDVDVRVPWTHLAVLLVSVAGLLALVVAGVTRTLRGSVLGAVLRLGDER